MAMRFWNSENCMPEIEFNGTVSKNMSDRAADHWTNELITVDQVLSFFYLFNFFIEDDTMK